MSNLILARSLHRLLPAALLLLLTTAPELFGQTISISNLWSISTSAGRPYLTNASASSYTERGVAYNAINNHAYIVSRAGTLRVAILDGDTGAELGFLNVSGISGGTFILSTMAVADDGAIYAANLTTGSATSPYKIYRWADEGSAPVAVYASNPSGGANNNRYGESFDVRGSGIDTEILASANGAAIVALFKPTDGTLSAFTSTRLDVTGTGAGDLTKGIAFGPTNTFYGKNNGSATVRFCSYDMGAGTATLLSSYTVASGIAPIAVDPVRMLLAGVESANAASPHNLRVYDLSSGLTPSQLFITAFPAPAANNGNIVGEVQMAGDHIFAVDAQNGVVMAKVYVSIEAVPPTITQQPASQTVVEGGYVTLLAGASGTKPLTFQWSFEGNPILGANTNFLNLTNVTMADAGRYAVMVSNIAGSTNSQDAVITITQSVRTVVLNNCWQLPPGSRPWITTDNNQRGLAYNPNTGHLLVISRSPTNAIYVLDAATGAQLGTLNVDPTIITGGTFAINLIGVDANGSIYAANLTTAASTTPVKIYRWAFEDFDIPPTVAYIGDPANGTGGTTSVRWGDNMDVRGDFPVQIILGSRAGNLAALLSSDDGTALTSTPIVTDAPNGELGLGIAFGAGNTFWAKSSGTSLRHIEFDAGVGTTLQTFGPNVFPGSITTLGVDPANNLLAGISLETPDNLRIYSLADLANPPVWLDTEFFPTDNANANGTGSIDFGGGKVFALDSNNGIIAYTVQPPAPSPTITCPEDKTVECGPLWAFGTPTASDPGCNGANVAIVVISTVTNALCGNTFSATRTWRATNSCGGVSPPCSQTVTVVDTTPPTIGCVADKNAACGTPWTFDNPSASDSCSTTVNVLVASTSTNGNSVTRTWMAIDGCQNSAMCSQTVTVVDTTAPEIVCPGNLTRTCTDNNGATVTFSVTATDGCDATPVINCTPASGSAFALGTTMVNCEAHDAAGNTNTCSFTVTVQDPVTDVRLSIVQDGANVVLSWPVTCTSYVLSFVPTLSSPLQWQPVGVAPVMVGATWQVTLPHSGDESYFKLRAGP